MTGAATSAAAAAAAKAAAAKVKTATGTKDAAMAEQQELAAKQAKIASFHQELTETCVDILARYMFANPSVQPRRLPSTGFLLKEGSSATWLLNTMLVTVTTSLCDQNASRGGLCERCHLICSKAGPASVPSSVDADDARKRHQSEFQAHRPSPSRYLPGASAKEDFDLRRQLSTEKLSTRSSAATEAKEEGSAKLAGALQEQRDSAPRKPEPCACWCTGWAEVLVRRPAGNVSWMCRIQNASLVSASHSELPLTSDLSALFQPSRDPEVRSMAEGALDMSKRIPVESLTDAEYEGLVTGQNQVWWEK